MTRWPSISAPRKPIRSRLFALSLALLASSAATAQTLTADDAARLAVERPDAAEILQSAIAVAEGDLVTAGTRPNPVASIEREGAEGFGGDGSETIIRLEQTLDVSGRRSLDQRGAEAAVRAARLGADSDRILIAAEARRRFYDLLAAEAGRDIHLGYQAELEALLAATERREQGGDASRYDVERVRQEVLSEESELAAAETDVFAARQALVVLVGSDSVSEDMALVGELLPPAVSETGDGALPPAIAALEAEAEAADWRQKAAGRTTPDITVGAGVRQTEGPSEDTGLLFSLSVPLPIFDRNQGAYQARAAEARAAQAQLRLSRDRINADINALRFRVNALREAAERFDAGALQSANELRRIALSAYEGGEIGVFETIDALGAGRDAELRSLALKRDAREAALALTELLPETE